VTIEAENDPPVVVDESITTGEDTPVVIDLLANDSDPDGDAIGVSSITQPSNGVGELGSDGTVIYTPDAGFVGEDGFTYEVCDQVGACAGGIVSITVEPLNQPPIAIDDVIATDFETEVTIAVLANDIDPEGLPLVVTGTTGPTWGAIEVDADGSITYTPPIGFVGVDGFSYTVCDPSGECDSARVTVSVGDVPLGNVSGRVWLDVDGDGAIDDGETDISGVRVWLVHTGPDGEFDTEDDVTYPFELTASPYLFTGILTGPAIVSIELSTLPPRLAATFDQDGGLDSTAIVSVIANDTVYADFGFMLVNAAPDLAPGSPTELAAPIGGTPPSLALVDPDGDIASVVVSAGSLPAGITLGPNGVFAGTATTTGSYPIVVTICDDFAPPACTDRALTIVVTAAAIGPPPPPPPSPDPTPIPDILPLPEATTTTVPGGGAATSTTIQPAQAPGSLPFTGAALVQLLVAGMALIGLGIGTVRRGRGH
jgi:hypothetical protein